MEVQGQKPADNSTTKKSKILKDVEKGPNPLCAATVESPASPPALPKQITTQAEGDQSGKNQPQAEQSADKTSNDACGLLDPRKQPHREQSQQNPTNGAVSASTSLGPAAKEATISDEQRNLCKDSEVLFSAMPPPPPRAPKVAENFDKPDKQVLPHCIADAIVSPLKDCSHLVNL